MNRPLPLIAGLLGVLFLIGAAMYWFGWFPYGGLYYPRRALVSLIIAIILFAFAWFQSRRGAPGA